MRREHRVELHDFARDAGLTPREVRDELAAGRLAFDVDPSGIVYTDHFSVLDWINRRINAISMFGIDKCGFPVFRCDWRSLENIPDRREVKA